MKKKQQFIQILTIPLLMLWIFVSVDKILHFSNFQHSILEQPFPNGLGYILVYLLPFMEILTCLLILFRRKTGLGLSTLLLSGFWLYVVLVVLGVFQSGEKSVIGQLSWIQLLWINLFFLAISIIAWRMTIQLYRDSEQENE